MTDCFACTALGHATPPPSSVMKSRRFNSSPHLHAAASMCEPTPDRHELSAGNIRDEPLNYCRRSSHQRIRPIPDKTSSTLTATSNCRSESRLKMRHPNHAPSSAAGMKVIAFQSSCVTVED